MHVQFEESCFDKTGQIVRLRDDAVPTRFNFPENLQKNVTVVKPRKPPAVRDVILPLEQEVNDADHISQSPCSGSFAEKNCSDIHALETSQQSVSSLDLSALSVHDHNYSVTESPRCLKRVHVFKTNTEGSQGSQDSQAIAVCDIMTVVYLINKIICRFLLNTLS